jgi:signal transduction histidine kinase
MDQEGRDEKARLEHLVDAVSGLASDLSLDGVLTRIVSAATGLVGARYAALGVLGDDADHPLRTFVHHGIPPDLVARIGDLPTGQGLLGLLVGQPHPLRLPDIAAHPVFYGFPDHHPPMSSFLGVPVRVRGRVFGNLYLTEKTSGAEFTEEDEKVLEALAAAAGVAIENANLYEEGARREAWLSAVAEITTTLLADDSSVDRALQLVADRAREAAGADVAWVVTGTWPDELHFEVVSGVPAELGPLQSLAMEASLAALVVRTGQPVSVDDLETDPRAVDPSSVTGWPQLGPAIMLPLRSGDRVEGVLALAWTRERREDFQRVDPAMPLNFAENALLALQVARGRADRQQVVLYEDRDRIGRDLHDLVIQRLFATGLGLQTAMTLAQDEALRSRLAQAIEDLDDTIVDIRRTIFALGQIGTSGDVQSEIERLVGRAGATMKLRPRLRIEGPLRTVVPPEVAPDLLAVLSEALANVSRHAHASSVSVTVSVNAHLRLRVADDGRGMGHDVIEGGLENMRARARKHGGDMTVESEAGAGTVITWSVPLKRHGSPGTNVPEHR